MQTDRYARSPMDKPRERSIGMSMGVRARARASSSVYMRSREFVYDRAARGDRFAKIETLFSTVVRGYLRGREIRFRASCALCFSFCEPSAEISRALSLELLIRGVFSLSLSPLVYASTYRGYLFIYVAQVFGTARALPASNRLLMDGDRRTRRAVI